MSHNRYKQTVNHTENGSVLRAAGFCLLLICLASILVFGNASASVARGGQSEIPSAKILKSSLEDLSRRDTAELDWQTQSYELNFDLPAHDWYDKLDLFLSAYPEGNVAQSTPLLISYNGAAPVPLYGRASRFDAHIRMDTSRIRLTGNRIKITYKTPIGNSCLRPDNGKWVLDLSRSKLVASVRAKKRAMQIVEIEKRLSHPMTAPKRVGIIAVGKNKLAYEALGAQAVAGRMDFVPDFKLGSGVTDMVVLIGTYTQIEPWLNNKSLRNTKGAKVLIDTGQKPVLILGGETEEQVLELVRAFASYHLPMARRSSVSVQDLYSSTELSPHAIVGAGEFRLSDIGSPALAQSWRPEPALVKFNIADPGSASGILTLNIHNAKDINPKSRLSVSLNNQTIGYTHLNKSSKTVAFKVEPGMFNPTNNRLHFKPEILPGKKLGICDMQQNIPTILISNDSRFQITTDAPTPATDLSRFAATGTPFDKNTVIVMTATSLKDRQASLGLLGYAARQFGPKWANAEYVSKLPARGIKDKNILFLGPDPISDPVLFNAAPGGLKLALRKKRGRPHASVTTTSPGQFASSDVEQIIKTMAAQNTSRLPTSRLQSGGLAALFPSPYAANRVIGLISADHTSKFASAMELVSTEDYWNALHGSVVRWDDKSILMTQITIPHMSTAHYSVDTPAPTAKPDGFAASLKNWFSSFSAGKTQALPNGQRTMSKDTANVKLAGAISPQNTMRNTIRNTIIDTAPEQKLRGGLPAKSDIQKPVMETTGLRASLAKASEFIAPSMTKLKLASLQARRDLTAWWQKTSTSTFENTQIRKWGQDIIHNPTAFFLLLVFLAFFLTALASPMSTRKQSKGRPRR